MMWLIRNYRFWEAAKRVNSFLAWVPIILLAIGIYILLFGDQLSNYVQNGGLVVDDGVVGGPSPAVWDNVTIKQPFEGVWSTVLRKRDDSGSFLGYVRKGDEMSCRAMGTSGYPLVDEEARPTTVKWFFEGKACSLDLPEGAYTLEWDTDFVDRFGRHRAFSAKSNVFKINPAAPTIP